MVAQSGTSCIPLGHPGGAHNPRSHPGTPRAAPEPPRYGMTWIETDPEDEDTAALLASQADPNTGRTDRILAVHGPKGEGLRAHLALYRSAMRPTRGLRSRDRELLALVVSLENGCHY